MIARPILFSGLIYVNPDFAKTYLGNGAPRIDSRPLQFSNRVYVGGANTVFFPNNGPLLTRRAIQFSGTHYARQEPPKTFTGNTFTFAILARQSPGAIRFFYQTEPVRQPPIYSSILPDANASVAFVRWQYGEITPQAAEFLFNNWNAQRA